MPPEIRIANPNLTHNEAIERFDTIQSGLDYQIFYNLHKGQNYSGIVKISFKVNNQNATFIDFSGDKLTKVIINGEELDIADPEVYASLMKEGHFHFKEGAFQLETLNTLIIHFENRYYDDGRGLHSMIDVDGNQYLFVASEPYEINRVFPAFDQPDLKGRYTIKALIPEGWEFITCTYAKAITEWKFAEVEEAETNDSAFEKTIFETYKDRENVQTGYNYWSFERSELLPTYLFAFNAGNYFRIELKEEERYEGVEMNLYCRYSFKQYVEQEAHNFFMYSKGSLKHHGEAFGVPYMFGKLDSIVVPRKGGAMEYPGAITYAEGLFPRGKNTVAQITLRGMYILHEISHMWFGDYVVVKWWNDTWLKESFADYIMFVSAENLSTSGWLGFETDTAALQAIREELWGYEEDARSTSHPIAAVVSSTQEADGVFDGISYSKGAACLKQLVFLIGYDKFKSAMKTYFKRHAWGNTELKDLMDIYQEALGDLATQHPAMDIQKWKEDWLGKAGTNGLLLTWPEEGTQGIITQTAVRSEYPTLRYHKIRIAFFDKDVQVIRTEDVIINNVAETTVELGDLTGVEAIMLNYQDFDFVNAYLDPRSFTFLKENLHKIRDPLTQGLILKTLYDMVKNVQIGYNEFLKAAVSCLTEELSAEGLGILFKFLYEILFSFAKDQEIRGYQHEIFTRLLTMSKKEADKQSDRYKVIMNHLIASPSTEEDFRVIYVLYHSLENHFFVDNSLFGIEDRWNMVKTIHRSQLVPEEEKKAIFDKLYAEDETDTKIEYERILNAALATGEARDQIWQSCIEENSLGKIQHHLAGLVSMSSSEPERRRIYKKYADLLHELIKNRSNSIARAFHGRLLTVKSDEVEFFIPKIDEALAKLTATDGSDDLAKKRLNMLKEDLQVVIKVRAFSK